VRKLISLFHFFTGFTKASARGNVKLPADLVGATGMD
jgi:hypothetical protein